MPATSWWFLLGHEPLLSLAELSAVFSSELDLLTNDIASAPFAGDPTKLMARLGGTIKIARELAVGLSEEALLDRLMSEIESVEGKIHFGLSLYAVPKGSEQGRDWGLQLKKRLKAAGRSVRFVDNRGKAALSSVSVEKNGLVARGREFLIVPHKKGFAAAQTVAVQPFESLSARDYGRPGRDELSGMLPPKLAMMMLNVSRAATDLTLLDPFCGSGTIISEALLMGFTKLVGVDSSTKAVADTKKNAAWVLKEQLPKTVTIKVGDAVDLQALLPAQSIDVVATEPYLGPPLKGRETIDQLRSSQSELQKLYRAAFSSLAKILKRGATVVFIFPRFQTQSGWVSTSDGVIADIKKDGFEPVPLLPARFSSQPYILYKREGQRVGREIWFFRFKG